MLDFKSRGHEFKSRQGQKKIDLKTILPWRILIFSDFEPFGGLLGGLNGHLLCRLLFIKIHFGVLCWSKVQPTTEAGSHERLSQNTNVQCASSKLVTSFISVFGTGSHHIPSR